MRAIISTADPNSDGMLDYKELLAVLKPASKAKQLGKDASNAPAQRPPMAVRNPLKALVAQSRSRTSSLGSNHSGITAASTSASFDLPKAGEVATTPSSGETLPPPRAVAGITAAGAFSAPSSARPVAHSRVGALSSPVVALASPEAAAAASSSSLTSATAPRAPLSASSSTNRSAAAPSLELPPKPKIVEKVAPPPGSAGKSSLSTPATSKEIADLEARKAAAVAAEDYVTAAQLKEQILALKATVATAANVPDDFATGEAAKSTSAAPAAASGTSFDSAVTQALPSKRNSNPFAHLLRKA